MNLTYNRRRNLSGILLDIVWRHCIWTVAGRKTRRRTVFEGVRHRGRHWVGFSLQFSKRWLGDACYRLWDGIIGFRIL